MLYNSLHMSDVVQIAFICALIFIPAGFYIAKHFYRIRVLFRQLSYFKPNLKDCGSFREYLDKEKNK